MRFVGILVWWAAWPFWLIYFKANSRRSRVVVVCEGQILLVKGWLGGDKWSLPGGGAHRGENMLDSAIRELNEESGINADPARIKPFIDFVHRENGISYHAYTFIIEPDKKPEVNRRVLEIADIKWFDAKTVLDLPLNKDARKTLQTYLSANR